MSITDELMRLFKCRKNSVELEGQGSVTLHESW